ncbi:LysM domain receptor-like kinase 3 [Vitis vinifera]|uniref:LysM domain receptor-like kinase 3 n=1 Tax=Vitis vinifera TaxID=29760 RepID=A0A438CA18_VITVI|nr:LysM domain receptor-like kinase 3 [Vitis vinifera]
MIPEEDLCFLEFRLAYDIPYSPNVCVVADVSSSSELTQFHEVQSLLDRTVMYVNDGYVAKQCVDHDPILRPDMKQVVISLSQILLSSVEWEATLAGNSQVFSGLVQGR